MLTIDLSGQAGTKSIPPCRKFHCCESRICCWLVPAGDGSSDHLEDKVSMPGMLELKEGRSRVGRDSPADVLLPIPTVSAVHAELENGAPTTAPVCCSLLKLPLAVELSDVQHLHVATLCAKLACCPFVYWMLDSGRSAARYDCLCRTMWHCQHAPSFDVASQNRLSLPVDSVFI